MMGRIFKDGDGRIFCAVMNGFRNLQLDEAGFGDTPEEAHSRLIEKLKLNPHYRNDPRHPFAFDRFDLQF